MLIYKLSGQFDATRHLFQHKAMKSAISTDKDLRYSIMHDDNNIVELAALHQQVYYNIDDMQHGDLPWNRYDCHWVLGAPCVTPRCFYFCLRTCEVFGLQGDLVLTEQEIFDNWDLVDAADRAELEAFVKFDVFDKIHINSTSTNNVIDATWVRRWKQVTTNEVLLNGW